jgi:hypothetical protein
MEIDGLHSTLETILIRPYADSSLTIFLLSLPLTCIQYLLPIRLKTLILLVSTSCHHFHEIRIDANSIWIL